MNGGAKSGVLPNWAGYFIHQTEQGNNTDNKNGGRPGEKIDHRTGNSSKIVRYYKLQPESRPLTSTPVGTVKAEQAAGTGSGSNVIREATSNANSTKTFYTDLNVPFEDGNHNHTITGFDQSDTTQVGSWLLDHQRRLRVKS